MEKEINNLEEEFNAGFLKAAAFSELESLKIKYLGRNSFLNQLFSKLPEMSKEERGIYGKRLNLLKNKITGSLDNKIKSIESEEKKIDLTFPPLSVERGTRHILNVVTEKICSIFRELAFIAVEGGEIEEEWYNFTALNIPLEHPSRDVFDTFYLDIPAKDKGKYLLRSHTSPSQIRIMQKNNPPFAVISPGIVYRPDEVDASHSFMFHQIEGFAVDRELNFGHLKGVLLHFAKTFFSPDVKLRFRPHFFPFTEPSAEVDVSCFICGGDIERKESKCSVCKDKGWLEVLGCGMIHPRVLSTCGINPKKYRGFAFGMGVERLAMLKYGINDIRLFFDNDVRFLEQFHL